MKWAEFMRLSYEDGLKYYHAGCGESAYPMTQVGDSTVWECVVHGFISAHAVRRKPLTPALEKRLEASRTEGERWGSEVEESQMMPKNDANGMLAGTEADDPQSSPGFAALIGAMM
jgi:hypothetical protein